MTLQPAGWHQQGWPFSQVLCNYAPKEIWTHMASSDEKLFSLFTSPPGHLSWCLVPSPPRFQYILGDHVSHSYSLTGNDAPQKHGTSWSTQILWATRSSERCPCPTRWSLRSFLTRTILYDLHSSFILRLDLKLYHIYHIYSDLMVTSILSAGK